MRSLFCLLAILMVPTAQAGALAFGAAFDQTHWRLERGSFSCRLVQTIPDYGRASLIQRGDGRLGFEIDARPGLYSGQMARVSIVPAPWQPDQHEKVMSLHSGAAGLPVAFGNDAARDMLVAFQKGHFASLSYPADGEPRIRVTVSSLHFRKALERLQKCVQALPAASFKDYARTVVHFASGSDRLNAAARKRLMRLAGYVRTYGGARLIVAIGDTDNVGPASFNYRLGERRARNVARMLKEHGVKVPIKVISHGEYRPIALNNSASGRAKNRRVVVTLEH